MQTSKRAPKEFVENFNLVAKHYGCTQNEISEMKQCAREHMDDAVACFASLAHEALAAA